MVFVELFKPSSECNSTDNRHNRAKIARSRPHNRNIEDIQCTSFFECAQELHFRIAKDKTKRDTLDFGELELFSRIITQDYRHKGKGCISNSHQEVICTSSRVKPMSCRTKSQKTFDDTTSRQNSQERSKDACNNAYKSVKRRLLFFCPALTLCFAEALKMTNRKNCVINICNVLTDYNLILTASL